MSDTGTVIRYAGGPFDGQTEEILGSPPELAWFVAPRPMTGPQPRLVYLRSEDDPRRYEYAGRTDRPEEEVAERTYLIRHDRLDLDRSQIVSKGHSRRIEPRPGALTASGVRTYLDAVTNERGWRGFGIAEREDGIYAALPPEGEVVLVATATSAREAA